MLLLVVRISSRVFSVCWCCGECGVLMVVRVSGVFILVRCWLIVSMWC